MTGRRSTTRSTVRMTALAAAAGLVASTGLVATSTVAASAASVQTQYTCATALGDQTMDVAIRLALPKTVKKNRKVAARPVRMSVVLPEPLVTAMRDVLLITSLSGSASDLTYSVGSKKVPLKNVTIPSTDVPASGAMTLLAKGTAQGFRLRKPGRYVVRAPRAFMFAADGQDGQPLPGSPFPCTVATGAPTKMGTIRVVR
ncbi:MAG TPA: DUF6801 domain-containing protein [Nocardioides sp.]|nr:DUF6801 domain-containing protein [Nocardioides sp.]